MTAVWVRPDLATWRGDPLCKNAYNLVSMSQGVRQYQYRGDLRRHVDWKRESDLKSCAIQILVLRGREML